MAIGAIIDAAGSSSYQAAYTRTDRLEQSDSAPILLEPAVGAGEAAEPDPEGRVGRVEAVA